MSDLFSIFQPGYEHLRRQKELDKVLVVDMKKGGRGRQPLDLESGSVTIEVPRPGVEGRDTRYPPSNDANEPSFDEPSGV